MEPSHEIQATPEPLEEGLKVAEKPVPPKPDKPKQTFKCLVCGKSWVFLILRFHRVWPCQLFFAATGSFVLLHTIRFLLFILDHFLSHRYSKKTSLFQHHKTHPQNCVHCGENRGSTVENIYEHNLKHINIRPFICKLCGDSFLRNQQFVEHEKSHDKPPEEPVIKESKYKCKTCQSSFSNWKLFYKHQQESGHFNEKFLCEICGSEFHSNFLLSQHIRRLHKRTGTSNYDEVITNFLCIYILYFRWNLFVPFMLESICHEA